jgi:hypothetical protein
MSLIHKLFNNITKKGGKSPVQKNSKISSEYIHDEIRNNLEWLLKDNYRYFKSYHLFEKPFDNLSNKLLINVTTPSSGKSYFIGIYYGVCHFPVELLINKIENNNGKVSRYERTIGYNSLNVGPNSKFVKYKYHGHWWIYNHSHLEIAKKQINQFIPDICFPYNDYFKSLENVRQALFDQTGKAIIMQPYKKILAIDILNRDKKRFYEDLDLFKKSFNKVDLNSEQFNAFASLAIEYIEMKLGN